MQAAVHAQEVRRKKCILFIILLTVIGALI